jgi:RHS repeat-associated protein
MWYLSDNLGGTNVLLDQAARITSELTYYPYGLSRYSSNGAAVKHQFTGKELDFSGLNYFGARYYDSKIAQFISVDPLVEDLPHNTSIQMDYLLDPHMANAYAYGMGNPLKYIDPDGRKFEFAKGSTSEFKKQIKQMIKYLRSHGVAGPVNKLARSKTTIYIEQGKTLSDVLYDPNTKTIIIHPKSGLEVGKGKVQSPALGFLHEAGHAEQHIIRPKQYSVDSTTRDSVYDWVDEKKVIKRIETPAAKKLGEPRRNSHGGKAVLVPTPIYSKGGTKTKGTP